MCVRSVVVGQLDRGLVFLDDQFQDVLRPGRHWILDVCGRVRVDLVSVRDVWLRHPALEAVLRSGALADELEVVELHDHERAILWVDARMQTILEPGLYALWTVVHEVLVDVVDDRVVQLDRDLSDSVQTDCDS
jgi:hypothetical protein